MKPDIHPKYFPTARVMCACGHTWTTGATQPEIRVDVCSNCHPFYTGEQRIVDTAGRVDRFRMRLAQKRDIKKADKSRKSKIEIIGPDEPIVTAPQAKPLAASAAVAEAEQIVNAAVAEAEQIVNAPVAATTEAVSVAEAEPEFRVRTVVEGETETVLADADHDDKPKRRPAPRKPRVRKPVAASREKAAPAVVRGEPTAPVAVSGDAAAPVAASNEPAAPAVVSSESAATGAASSEPAAPVAAESTGA